MKTLFIVIIMISIRNCLTFRAKTDLARFRKASGTMGSIRQKNAASEALKKSKMKF